jgi:hypothetical protein
MIILPRQARDKHRENSKRKAFCAGYDRVLVLGDSMGGGGALMLAPLAHRVLCFTPQVRNREVFPTFDSLEYKIVDRQN